MKIELFTSSLSDSFWDQTFRNMERQSKKSADERKSKYVYFGEIDDPYEMLEYGAPLEQVQSVGKTNWLQCEDGAFITVGDCELDFLIESGKVERRYDDWDDDWDD